MSALPDRKDRPEYVSLCPSDWLGGCATLPPMAEWVYLQISLYCMDKGEAAPGAIMPMILARHGGDWQADLDILISLRKVHKTAGGGFFVKRALVEYERASAALLKKRKAGAKGAQKRWQNNDLNSNANGNANATPIAAEQSRAEQTCDLSRSQEAGDLIFEVDSDIWNAFVEHRIKLKAPLTERAGKMIRTELIKIHEQYQHDPTAVLRQSIMRGWKGVFPLKQETHASGWRFDDD